MPSRPSRDQTVPATVAYLPHTSADPLVPDLSSILPSTIGSSNTRKMLSSKPNNNNNNNNNNNSSNNRRHHRSLSHPFPSPFHFGFGKKGHKHSKHDFLDSDGEDDFGMSYGYSGKVSSGGAGPGGEPLTTDQCMTCNSTVRYPRSHKSFRCESCLMVNDLVPVNESRDLSDRSQPANSQGNYQRRGTSLACYHEIFSSSKNGI